MKKIPITVITGFLGVGKTTLVHNMIKNANGKKIAVAPLNSPRSLNALSGEMIDLLYPKLTAWQQQDDIAAVFLQGEGEKAFCAGGDIVHMYNEMKKYKGTLSSKHSFAMETSDDDGLIYKRIDETAFNSVLNLASLSEQIVAYEVGFCKKF